MKRDEAIQYILSKQGFVPYFAILSSYNENDEIPGELIELCLGQIKESEVKVSNVELSKLITNG